MEGIVKKLDTKTLTGRYDMKQLIKVQQVEQWFMTKLVELYGVEDEDGLPKSVGFDLLELLETDKDKRAAFLKEKLAGCPKNAAPAVEELLKKVDELNLTI